MLNLHTVTPARIFEHRNTQAHHSLIKNKTDTKHKWIINITLLRTQTTTLSASLHLTPMTTLTSLSWALGTRIFCQTPRQHTCYLAWFKDNHTEKLTSRKASGPVWEGFTSGFTSGFRWSPPKRLFCNWLHVWSRSWSHRRLTQARWSHEIMVSRGLHIKLTSKVVLPNIF